MLIDIDEDNWTGIIALKLSEEQLKYVADPMGILARAYVYRKCNEKFKNYMDKFMPNWRAIKAELNGLIFE